LQHGGAPSALLARAVESVETAQPMQTVRFTVELWRPLAMVPMRCVTEVQRAGRSAQWVRAALVDEAGTEFASAMALRLVSAEIDPPAIARPEPLPFRSPEDLPELTQADVPASGFAGGVAFRPVSGGFDGRGPGTVWFRLKGEIVEGEAPSPLQRVAAAADFGNGISSVLEFKDWTFLNGDLSIHLTRPLSGEWVLLDAKSWIEPEGRGLASAALWDEAGALGRSLQSLIVRPQRSA
jgi:hypothetical protein